MSKELRVNFNAASATLYAQIRRISDSYVWNGSAFAAWSAGSIATYSVSMTDGGGDLYTADMPSAIVAGDYRYEFYEQAGGSPAITDLLLGSQEVHWDGASVSSVSTITLSSYALTSLDNQKRYQRITTTDDDTLITQLVNAVSAEIERICGIQFVARDRRERLNGSGQRRLTLKQWPVIDLFRLAWGMGTAFTANYSGSAVRAEIGVSDTDVRLSTYSTSGAATTNRLLFTDYPSVSLMVAAINAVSGWTATTTTNIPSADLNPQAGSDAKSRSVLLTYPDMAYTNATVNYATGEVELNGSVNGWWGSTVSPLNGRRNGYEAETVMPCGHQYIFVHYRAGFEAVPADVELVCNQLVSDAYNDTFVARNVSMMNIGPFTWKASKDQVESIQAQLSHYIDLSRCVGAA